MDKCIVLRRRAGRARQRRGVRKYGRNRLAEGKLPACAEMCSTKALLAGDGDVVADIFRTCVIHRGKGAEVWAGAPPMAPRQARQPPAADAKAKP